MDHRTVSVFSAGKLFSCTGWRVGWAIGPEHILKYSGVWSMCNIFGINRPTGKALHYALEDINKPYEGEETF